MNYATLGAICDQSGGSVQTGPFGSQLHQSDYKFEGVPVVMPQDIIDDRISEIRIARIDESLAKKLSRHLLNEEDIVFPRRGEISKRAIVEPNQAGYFCGTGCLKISIPPTEILPRWLYYYLGQEQVVRWIESKAIGATMLNLNTGILRSLPLEYPNLDDQHRIVGYLSAYDDLIAINQRRIQLLEKAARCLYREWFVHLRFPGYEFVPVKDGVPEGWMKGTAFDFLSILSGGTPKTGMEHYWNGEIPFFTPKDCTETFYVMQTEKMVTESGVASCNSRLFPKETIFITARGTVGKIALAQKPMAMNQSCYALVPKHKFDNLFLFLAIKEAVEHVKQVASGGVFSAIVVDTFKVIPFVLPTLQLTDDFGKVVRPFFDQIETLIRQNVELKKARDLLLPKLMSGQIDVSRIPLPGEMMA